MIIISLLIIILCPSKKQREKKRIKKEVEKRLRLVLIYLILKSKRLDPDQLNQNDHSRPPELSRISMPDKENLKPKIRYKKAGIQALIAPFQMSNKLIRVWLKFILTHQDRKMCRYQQQEMHLKIPDSKVPMTYKTKYHIENEPIPYLYN